MPQPLPPQRKRLVDTGARIRIEQLSDTMALISVDEVTVELTFPDLERLASAIQTALRVHQSRDVRD